MHKKDIQRILFLSYLLLSYCLTHGYCLLITGVFTAPVRGIYHFVVFAYGLGHESTGSGVSLHKNREHITVAWCRQPSQTVAPSTGASLLLEIGDVVYVKLWPNSWLRDNGLLPNTFSGHLLFTLWGTIMSFQLLSNQTRSASDLHRRLFTCALLSFGNPFISPFC